MGESPDIPISAVRKALTRICRHGAEPYWILETAYVLLDLPLVRERVKNPHATDEELADAVIGVITDAVKRIHGPHRVILTVCLALEPEYQGLKVQERQAIAGREFRGGKNRVSWGAMRKTHLKHALDRLAHLIHPTGT